MTQETTRASKTHRSDEMESIIPLITPDQRWVSTLQGDRDVLNVAMSNANIPGVAMSSTANASASQNTSPRK